jgi:hypothetical protein
MPQSKNGVMNATQLMLPLTLGMPTIMAKMSA